MIQQKVNEIVALLEPLRDSKNVAGMERFGIVTDGKAFGVATPELQKIAKMYRNDHDLAVALWETGYHELRKMAPMTADKNRFTPQLMDQWTREFASWDICDGACSYLFRYLPFANEKVFEYAVSEEEFVRRTAFSLIAEMAVVDKKGANEKYLAYLPLIEKYATDPRNFVKKAVNWALRQIGKKNKTLYASALEMAERLAASEDKTAQWIGKDALRELRDEKIIGRIKEA
ncbi:DNA alkylation repair protein [Bacteroidales bacterium OttesenSCG-928-J16]|nr:DNA alkylation repair protein [Bacteroidales bacterium OttesenSCG-928-J16]